MRERSEFCHNCGIRLSGTYCSACGQKDVPLTVTLHDFFHELTHETLHVDGRIFQTIRRLLLWPGFLTREYIQGRRARWISPIRLYLVFSVAYFALSAFTGRVGVSERQPRSGLSFMRGAPQTGTTAENDAEAEDAARRAGFENLAAMRAAINDAILSWVPRVMFILMPLFALLVALAFRRVDRNYLHHLIFAVHVHAAWFAAGTIATIIEMAARPLAWDIQPLGFVFIIVYAVFAFRRVYGRVRFAFARIAFVMAAYMAVIGITFAAIIIPVVVGHLLIRSA